MTIRKYQAGNRGATALKEEPSNAKPIDLQLLIDQLRIALENALANGGGTGAEYDDTAIQQAISALQSGKANSSHDHNTVYYTIDQVDQLLLSFIPEITVSASGVQISDVGDYFTSTHIEGALQEVGLSLGNIQSVLDSINGGAI